MLRSFVLIAAVATPCWTLAGFAPASAGTVKRDGDCTAAKCTSPGAAQVGEVLHGEFSEFRSYNLYDLRRPRKGERDLRIGETLYRVDADDLKILRVFPLPEIVLN